jgi:mannose-6-phosphate isomerase-like protein (cupin superfamily)
VIRGRLRLEFRDRIVELGPGQCCVVPRGVEHHPVAKEECWIVLVETVTTPHTGELTTERTRSIEEQLA